VVARVDTRDIEKAQDALALTAKDLLRASIEYEAGSI